MMDRRIIKRGAGLAAACALVGLLLTDVNQAAATSEPHPAIAEGQEIEPTTAAPDASTGSCGVERWSVKTGTDPDAAQVDPGSATSTTISALDALPAPSSLPSDGRIQPTETTVYSVHATLHEYKLEDDSDYHLVLDDGTGDTMIAEIPDPACVGSDSPLRSDIESARGEFDAAYTATDSFQTADVPVTVTGVGFFDYDHGQTGVAPNAIELHPVLDIHFDGTTTLSQRPLTAIPAPPPAAAALLAAR